jgi:hypothetical protein
MWENNFVFLFKFGGVTGHRALKLKHSVMMEIPNVKLVFVGEYTVSFARVKVKGRVFLKGNPSDRPHSTPFICW